MSLTKIGLPLLAVLAGGFIALSGAQAQYTGTTPALNPNITAKDPPGPVPLPSNIPFVLNKDFKWPACNGPCRSQTLNLWGNPNQPGPYGILIKWYPGNFSRPHQHNNTRWIYVLSGTWWVSTSNVYDLATTYPMRAGTYVVNEGGTTHWDGSRAGDAEPSVILLTGIGPVVTTQIGPDGKPLPPAPAAAAH
jgi:quercetin dioxygenase-like cupin family protein